MPLMKVGYLVVLVLLASCAWACSIRGAVHRRFPLRADGTKLYMGFGNLGLYRTDGVAIDIICDHDKPSRTSRIELHQLQPTKTIDSYKGIKFKMTTSVGVVQPGAVYQCKCIPKDKNATYSIELHIPDVTPCNSIQCSQSVSSVCYDRQDPSGQCNTWITQLLEMGWNDGLTHDALVAGVKLNVNAYIYAQLKTMPQWFCHMDSDQKFTIDKNTSFDNICHFGALRKRDPAGYQYLPQLRTHDNCKSRIMPNGETISLEYFPLTFDGDTVYLGAVYYVLQSNQPYLLKTPCIDEHIPKLKELKIDCYLYVWKRNASIQTAKMTSLVSSRGNCLFSKKWSIGYTLLGPGSDDLNMIGCSLYNLEQYTLKYKHELTTPFPAVAVPLYRQVEFFVGPLASSIIASLDSQSNKNCVVTIGNELMTGTVSMTENGGCTCGATLVACNPIRIQKTLQFDMDKCPPTTTAVPSGKPYLLYVAIGVAALLAVTTTIILCFCFYKMCTDKNVAEKQSKKSQSVKLQLDGIDLTKSTGPAPDEFFYTTGDTVASVTPNQALSPIRPNTPSSD